MKRMTSAQLWGGPKSMRKTKERLARAQLLRVAARDRAMELAQKHESSPVGRRATYAQRRRLAQLQAL
jgi:hypothetical protein